MSFDLVILGASGFTGKYVIREVLKFLNVPSSPLKDIALAGRNPSKVEESLRWAAQSQAPPLIPILTADVNDPASLRRLCSQTKLVLNCVGPFRLYGEPVVSACVNAGCDYLDITGEPDFMERMEAKFHAKALESGSLVISACGFDSVPAELGFMFNSVQWTTPSAPNKIEAYLTLESDKRIVGNMGTLESVVLSISHFRYLQELRRTRKRVRCPIPGPVPRRGPVTEHAEKIGLWGVRLPSSDAMVVRRTLETLVENPDGLPGINEGTERMDKRKAFWSTVKPAYFGVRIGSKSLLGVLRFMVLGISIGIFSSISIGRRLLLKYPSIFTLGGFRRTGPTEEEVRSASFKMWFVGKGFADVGSGEGKPDMEIVTRVMGPELGYQTTPIVLVQCALVLLSSRGGLPKGVYSPGAVFGPTDLQSRLQENGISFDVVSKSSLSS